jgi:hypothetical protein
MRQRLGQIAAFWPNPCRQWNPVVHSPRGSIRSTGEARFDGDCRVKLSVVTTLYRSAPTIGEFYRRIIAAAEQITHDIEVLMVNDGSPDDSLDLALALHQADPRVVVVDLARNFGHHKAMMTGLAHAIWCF